MGRWLDAQKKNRSNTRYAPTFADYTKKQSFDPRFYKKERKPREINLKVKSPNKDEDEDKVYVSPSLKGKIRGRWLKDQLEAGNVVFGKKPELKVRGFSDKRKVSVQKKKTKTPKVSVKREPTNLYKNLQSNISVKEKKYETPKVYKKGYRPKTDVKIFTDPLKGRGVQFKLEPPKKTEIRSKKETDISFTEKIKDLESRRMTVQAQLAAKWNEQAKSRGVDLFANKKMTEHFVKNYFPDKDKKETDAMVKKIQGIKELSNTCLVDLDTGEIIEKEEKEIGELANTSDNLRIITDIYRDARDEPAEMSLLEEVGDGIRDTFVRQPEKLIPFVGHIASYSEMKDIINASKKHRSGKTLTAEERSLLEKYKTEMTMVKSGSVGYMAGQMIAHMPTHFIEYAALANFTGAIKLTGIAKIAASGASGMLNVPLLAEEYIRPQVAREIITQTDSTSSEKALDFVRALGTVFTEYASEASGEVVGDGLGKVKKLLLGKYASKFNLGSKQLGKVARRIGWDGVFGEVFEEEVNEPIQALIQGRDYDDFLTTKEGRKRLFAEVIGIGLFGSAFWGINKMAATLSPHSKNIIRKNIDKMLKDNISDLDVDKIKTLDTPPPEGIDMGKVKGIPSTPTEQKPTKDALVKESKYFTNKTDLPFFDDAILNTNKKVNNKKILEYYKTEKNSDISVEHMSPDEYLKRLSDSKIGAKPAIDSIKFQLNKLKNGEKLDLPILTIKDGKVISQEGRNRALAAKKFGIKKIPVIIENKITKPEVKKTPIKEAKKLTKETKTKAGQSLKDFEPTTPTEQKPTIDLSKQAKGKSFEEFLGKTIGERLYKLNKKAKQIREQRKELKTELFGEEGYKNEEEIKEQYKNFKTELGEKEYEAQELDKEMENLISDIDEKHEKLANLRDKQDELYDLKDLIIEHLDIEPVDIHKFVGDDKNLYPMYKIGNLKFHTKIDEYDVRYLKGSEKFDVKNLKEIDEISSEDIANLGKLTKEDEKFLNFIKNKIKTKPQLKQIWKEANKKPIKKKPTQEHYWPKTKEIIDDYISKNPNSRVAIEFNREAKSGDMDRAYARALSPDEGNVFSKLPKDLQNEWATKKAFDQETGETLTLADDDTIRGTHIYNAKADYDNLIYKETKEAKKPIKKKPTKEAKKLTKETKVKNIPLEEAGISEADINTLKGLGFDSVPADFLQDYKEFKKTGIFSHETPVENLEQIKKEGIKEPFGFPGKRTKTQFVKDGAIIEIKIPKEYIKDVGFGMRNDELSVPFDIKPEWITNIQEPSKHKQGGLFRRKGIREEMISARAAIAQAKEIAKRLKLTNLEQRVLDKILDTDGAEALAVALGNEIYYTGSVPKFAGLHEIIHIIHQNVDNMDIFKNKGITKAKLDAALEKISGDKDIREVLAEDGELLAEYKSIKRDNIIKRLLRAIRKFLSNVFSKKNKPIVRDFLDTVLEGKAKTETKLRISDKEPEIKGGVGIFEKGVAKKISPAEEERIYRQEMLKKIGEPTDFNRDLKDAIIKLGGVKPSEAEEIKLLPNFIKRKGGMPLDELVAKINAELGANFKDSNELAAAIMKIKSQGMAAAKLEATSVRDTDEAKTLPDRLKDLVNFFILPSTSRKPRLFGLLGNKMTSIPLFRETFAKWAKEGVKTIVEPYGGAFTLVPYSIDKAARNGLEGFYSNIFDKDKFLIIRNIKSGRYNNVVKEYERAIKRLDKEIIHQSEIAKDLTPKKVINNFKKKYPDDIIGGAVWRNYVNNETKVGAEVTVLKEVYKPWRKVFQKAINAVYKEGEVENLEDAVMKSYINRIGVYNDKGQKFVSSTYGFRSMSNIIYGNNGIFSALERIKESFRKLKKAGVKVILYNRDGAQLVQDLEVENPKEWGWVLGPPYISTAETYKNLENQETFTNPSKFVEEHKKVFNKRGKVALTNDVNADWLDALMKESPNNSLFAYREGRTPTSLFLSGDVVSFVEDLIEQRKKKRLTGVERFMQKFETQFKQLKKGISKTYSRPDYLKEKSEEHGGIIPDDRMYIYELMYGQQRLRNQRGNVSRIMKELTGAGIREEVIDQLIIGDQYLKDMVQFKREGNKVVSATIRKKTLDYLKRTSNVDGIPDSELKTLGKKVKDTLNWAVAGYETSARFFRRIGMGFYHVINEPIRVAERQAVNKEREIKEDIPTLWKLSKKERKVLGAHLMKIQGVKNVPFSLLNTQLNARQKKARAELKRLFRKTYPQVKEAAKSVGKEVGRVPNYFPLYTKEDMEILQFGNLFEIARKDVYFASIKERTGPYNYGFYEPDIAKTMRTWVQNASRYIEMSPVAVRIKYLIESDQLKNIVPVKIHNKILDWYNYTTETPQIKQGEKILRALRTAQGTAILGFKYTVPLKQPLNFLDLWAVTSAKDIAKGIGGLIGNKKLARYIKNSPAIQEREVIDITLEGIGNPFLKLFKIPTIFMDKLTAKVSKMTLMRKLIDNHRRKGRRLDSKTFKKIDRFSNDMVDGIMGALSKSQAPPHFRSEAGKNWNMFLSQLTAKAGFHVQDIASHQNPEMWKQLPQSHHAAIVRSVMVLMTTALAEVLISNLYWEDDPEELSKELVLALLGNFPTIGGLAYAVTYNKDYEPMPVLAIASDVLSEINYILYSKKQETKLRHLKKLVFNLTRLMGIPKQLQYTYEGVQGSIRGYVEVQGERVYLDALDDKLLSILNGRFGSKKVIDAINKEGGSIKTGNLFKLPEIGGKIPKPELPKIPEVKMP